MASWIPPWPRHSPCRTIMLPQWWVCLPLLCNLPPFLLPCFCLFLFCATACTCCIVTAANRFSSDLGTLVSCFCNKAQHFVCRLCSCSLPMSPHGTSCVCGIACLTMYTALVQQSFSTPAGCKSNASLAVICLRYYRTCSSHCCTQTSLRPQFCSALCAHNSMPSLAVKVCYEVHVQTMKPAPAVLPVGSDAAIRSAAG